MVRAERKCGRVTRLCTVLVASAGLLALQTAPAPAPQSLKDTTGRYVGSAVAASALAEEADYRSVLTREFSSVTPENAMKWAVIEPERGQYDWSAADAIVDYAQQTGKTVRGHTLVWRKQYPDWLNSLSATELRSVLKKHITTVVSRYEGRIRAWNSDCANGNIIYVDTWPTAIALTTSGHVDLEARVTARYPLERTEAALEAGDDPLGMKAVVTVNAEGE